LKRDSRIGPTRLIPGGSRPPGPRSGSDFRFWPAELEAGFSHWYPKSPDTVRKVVKGAAEALKAAIADPAHAVAALKKREPLVDEKVERRRLDLVIENSILTEHVRREGLSAVEPERMQETIDMVARKFDFPAPEASSIYTDTYLPPRDELGLRP
jgi:NitT/TauT family transport system substrate-binding protein